MASPINSILKEILKGMITAKQVAEYQNKWVEAVKAKDHVMMTDCENRKNLLSEQSLSVYDLQRMIETLTNYEKEIS